MQGVCYQCNAHLEKASLTLWQQWAGIYVWLCGSCAAQAHHDAIRKGKE